MNKSNNIYYKTSSYQDNANLNDLINELKNHLNPIQKKIRDIYSSCKYPTLFIIGAPRSGTTILLQWIASLGMFSYPSNFLTRFAFSPYIGALVQNMIFDKKFDFHGDFSDIQSDINFSSDLGKSKGALATNEFQHFFRNYMKNPDPSYIDQPELENVDWNGIRSGIASVESVFGKPFVTKATMLQFNIDRLFKSMTNSIFLYIERQPIYNIQSILIAREKYYNDRNAWWSVCPKEYYSLKKLDYYHQIAGQVYFTNKSIVDNLKKIPDSNQIKIKYEYFCKDPESVFNELKIKFSNNGYIIDHKYTGAKGFEVSNRRILPDKDLENLLNAYNYFAEGNTDV